MELKQSKFSFKAILSALIILFTIAIPAYTTKAETKAVNDQNKIQLYYNDISYIYHGTTRDILYIKVAKDIDNPQVTVKYQYAYYPEVETTAVFYKSLDDNYSIYTATVQGSGELKYSLNVKGDNAEYIDNNNGKLYPTSDRLGAANITPIRTYGILGSDHYDVRVAVKNLGYTKDVKIHYTVDNWKTYKESSLKYDYSSENFETWSGYLDTTGGKIDNFQYAVYYTVNGETYWDNNFGLNYDSRYYFEY